VKQYLIAMQASEVLLYSAMQYNFSNVGICIARLLLFSLFFLSFFFNMLLYVFIFTETN